MSTINIVIQFIIINKNQINYKFIMENHLTINIEHINLKL